MSESSDGNLTPESATGEAASVTQKDSNTVGNPTHPNTITTGGGLRPGYGTLGTGAISVPIRIESYRFTARPQQEAK